MKPDALADIIAEIKASNMRPEHQERLVEIVQSWSITYFARVEVIAKARKDRSDAIRQAVRESAQRVLADRPGLTKAEATGIVRRLAWIILKEANPNARRPCARTVKSELHTFFPKSGTSRATSYSPLIYASGVTCATSLST